MTTVRRVLQQKSPNLWTIAPDATVFDAIAKMADKNVGALVVMEGEKLVGIITERLYARRIALKGKTSPNVLVEYIMSQNVICVRPEQSVEECMALMTGKRFRYLVVLEDGRVIGIISIGDLVKSIIDDQRFVIDQLAHYVQG